MNFRKLAILAAAMLIMSVPSFANICGFSNQLVCQEFDGTGNAYGSQNDTASFGLFAQMYDNLTVTGSGQYSIDSIHFEGEYFNPPSQGSDHWLYGRPVRRRCCWSARRSD